MTKESQSQSIENIDKLSPAQKRALLEKILAERAADTNPSSELHPLSFAQQRLWFIDQLSPGQSAYSIPAALRLEGPLDVTILHKSLDHIINRHEILRTCFIAEEDNDPGQLIVQEFAFELPLIEITNEHEYTYKEQVKSLLATPFDLQNGPLLRARLLRINQSSHILLLCIHHIIADYWSLRVLMRELVELYRVNANTNTANLPELPIQYLDYAVWQHEHQKDMQQQLDYWHSHLADMPNLLQLPTDYPRPARQSFKGARHSINISNTLTDKIKLLAKKHHASLFATLLAALQVLLFRWSKQNDFAIGTTATNRDRKELRDLIGLFVNNLVLRARPSDEMSFTTLLSQASRCTLDALANQSVPFEQVVESLDPARQLSHNALFQVMFVLHNTPLQSVQIPNLSISSLEIEFDTSRFDLSLDLVDTDDTLKGFIEYSTDLFSEKTIERFSEHLTLVLHAVVETPGIRIGEIPLLSSKEQKLFNGWNATATEIPTCCAHQLFEKQVAKSPNENAVSDNNKTLTYAELNQQANQLAHLLLQHGAGPNKAIAMALSRDINLVVTLLAILKTGSYYLPLDLNHPTDRILSILADNESGFIICKSNISFTPPSKWTMIVLDHEQDTINTQPLNNIEQNYSAEQLAYLIYTSGSSGQPKGVPIRHSSLVNLLTSMTKAPGIENTDRLLAVTTIAFDIATLEILLPLISGAELVIANDAVTSDGATLRQLIKQADITMMQATPSTWRLLMDSDWQSPSKFKCLSGGEALDVSLTQNLLKHFDQVWNLYGPTETTIWSAALQLTPTLIANNVVPIGKPIDNTAFHIIDSNGMDAPIGVAGELCISGHGLSPGYHARPELTTTSFFNLENDFGEVIRAYRTGDLVSRREDGLLVFRGRLDHQIKLRGYRIELGDIENHLTAHETVTAASVILDEEDEPRLIAYCETQNEKEINEAELHRYLLNRLPNYMVPAAIVKLDSLPLTANGKLDHKALPKLHTSQENNSELKTDTEKKLATIWEGLLNRNITSSDTNFFISGGHSLLAARLATQIRKFFNCELAIREIFEKPTLGELANSIDTLLSKIENNLVSIPRRDPTDELSLSAAQYRQWVLAGLEPNNPYYNIPAAIQLSQRIDRDIFQNALQYIVNRHDVLNCCFQTVDGKPHVVIEPSSRIPINFHKLEESNQNSIINILCNHASNAIDVTKSPLLRAVVIDTPANKTIVMLVLHHIIGDARSLEIIFEELILIYGQLQSGATPCLPELPIGYLDYANWSNQQDNSISLNYWSEQLNGIPPLLDLPTDYPRPADQNFSAGEQSFTIAANIREALETLAHNENATLFMLLLTAFNALLYRFSGAKDIVIGCPIGHRPHTELENVVGLFVNTLPIRTIPEDQHTFANLLAQVRETVLAGFEHQDASFEQIVSELDLPRSWGHAPVFQVMFLWQATADRLAGSTQGAFKALSLPTSTTKVDLTLNMSAASDGCLHGRIEYRDDLFHASSMSALVDAFQVLLEHVAIQPFTQLSQLPLINQEQIAFINSWNETKVNYHTQNYLHESFEAQAHKTPNKIAVRTNDVNLSYADLNTAANHLAHMLIKHGASPDQRVGVCLPRNSNLIITILGILKSGAAYVPIDPNYPRERIDFILKDSQLCILVTDRDVNKQLNFDTRKILCIEDVREAPNIDAPIQNPFTTLTPSNLAYIIYTSGSTGVPKGVAIEHHSAITLIQWAANEFSSKCLAGVLASTSVCFDLSIFEIFTPLSIGGSIILSDNALTLEGHPAREKITLINTVPTAAAELVRQQVIPPNVTTINVAGEPLSSDLVRNLYSSGAVDRVYNLYGPSEDTTYSTFVLLDKREPAAFSPIGRPIANTRAYVLDEYMQLVAPGFPGELYLAGDGVSRGYWQRPELTSTSYIPDPFNVSSKDKYDGLLYATGDRVRIRHDGELAFLGRADQQVKLRGFRIELGEIESILETYSSIYQAVLKVWHDSNTDKDQLIAYLVLDNNVVSIEDGNSTSDLAEILREFLTAKLPNYMLPNQYIILNEMPLLPNGKVARQSLPEPEIVKQNQKNDPPINDDEKTLASLWQTVLQQPFVGRHDNFFSLGGDSILALQLISLARQNGIGLTPRDIFQFPTVAGMASRANLQDVFQPKKQIASGKVSLTPIQHWFFELPLQYPSYWNQAVLLNVDRELNHDHLRGAVSLLIKQHDMLRSTYQNDGQKWTRLIAESTNPPIHFFKTKDTNFTNLIQKTAEEIQSKFDLEHGPLWAVINFEYVNENSTTRRLLIICHHLLIDGVSWRILISDLQLLLMQFSRTGNATLPPPSTPASYWADFLIDHPITEKERKRWETIDQTPLLSLPLDNPSGTNLMRDSETVSITIESDTTDKLIRELPNAYSIELDELIITALARALAPWHGQPSLRLALEGYGRANLNDNIDLSRTIGWLTTIYPVNLVTDINNSDRALGLAKSVMRSIPHRGLEYGVLHYLQSQSKKILNHIRFNYFGQTDQLFSTDTWFSPASEPIGTLRHPDDSRDVVFDINALVAGGELKLHWSYSKAQFQKQTIEKLLKVWHQEINTLLNFCLSDSHSGGYIAEEFPQMDFEPGELDDLLNKLT
ncbi:MAG: amino acid adenylation domain-containing protein [Pseudomonadota bacterium]